MPSLFWGQRDKFFPFYRRDDWIRIRMPSRALFFEIYDRDVL